MQKKLVKLLVSLVTCFSVFTLAAFADTTHENSDTITYNDKEYNKSELSQETIEWLERYNSLPSDLQDMVNHVPVELRTPVPYSSIGTIDANVPDPDYTPPSLLEDLLPTGGSEPVYNPDFWNAPENIKRANCYAYAMDVIQSFEGKLQPGQLSGHEYTSLPVPKQGPSFFTAVMMAPIQGQEEELEKYPKTQDLCLRNIKLLW